MNAEEFVDVVKLVVLDGAVRSEIEILDKPPGRRPRQELLDMSRWYHSLAADDRKMLHAVIQDVAHGTVFGFFCVLDGIRAIENGPDKGSLELRHVGHTTTFLNGPEGPMLHELL